MNHEWGVQLHIFFGPAPWEVPKDQNSLNFNYKVKLYMSSHTLGTWGAGGQKFNFSEHGHVAYQIKGDDQ